MSTVSRPSCYPCCGTVSRPCHSHDRRSPHCWELTAIIQPAGDFCPGGATDSSPAIHCWERPVAHPLFRPVGTVEAHALTVQPSPRDATTLQTRTPSDKSLGYSQTTLRVDARPLPTAARRCRICAILARRGSDIALDNSDLAVPLPRWRETAEFSVRNPLEIEPADLLRCWCSSQRASNHHRAN